MEMMLGFLFYVATLLTGSPELLERWNIKEQWVKKSEAYVFSASTKFELESCKNDQLDLQLPQVVHGVHKIFVDGKLVFSSGDSTFKNSSPFYFYPTVSCKLLKGDELTWEVTTYSKFFARFKHMPFATNQPRHSKFFDLQLNIICFSSIIFIVLFSMVCFFGKVNRRKLIASTVGGLLLSVYALMTVNSDLPISLSMLSAHKIADVTLSAGMILYAYCFYLDKLLNAKWFFVNLIVFVIATIMIIFGSNGDIVQLGTTLEMPFTFLSLLSIAWNLYLGNKNREFSVTKALETLSISAFIVCGTNDLLHIFGVISSYMVLPVGATFGLFFLAAAVNQDIERTYLERDDLVANLKSKVAEQTRHLSDALDQVRKSQVELVQSARLASLGTLSAGIAHEINNAINYVNGAVVPLERKVMKSIPDADRPIVEKLFAAIKEGTHLTVDIVRSLRNFTGLNQAKVKDVSIGETVHSVLTILKSKLSHIKITLDIEKDLAMNCYQVGLNQVFMNLISNAIDVLPPSGGEISISAKRNSDGNVEIKVRDNGAGIPDTVKARIFDPFYTTKDVGKGTGLGLHIVQKEIERHSGAIAVNSEVGKGTTFSMVFPVNTNAEILKGAA